VIDAYEWHFEDSTMTQTTLIDLTQLIFDLNHLIDSGLHQGISIDEVHQHIDDGDVFSWLEAKFPDEMRYNINKHFPEVSAEIGANLKASHDAYAGSEDRKMGVSNNGICLLLAWLNDLIQQRRWIDRRVAGVALS